jgi:hypothetical protein
MLLLPPMPTSMGILEAARRLGVSPDTVRRHIRIGLLEAHQRPRGRGYTWVVDVPDTVIPSSPRDGRTPVSDPPGASGASTASYDQTELVRDLRRALDVAYTEIEARRAEVARLLALLERAQPPGSDTHGG